jgi:hypothetical protein
MLLLWWIDLGHGILFRDPFDEKLEEVRFVALPEGREPSAAGEDDLARRKCVATSAGRLRYVHIDAAQP